jgi:hypothetical protein
MRLGLYLSSSDPFVLFRFGGMDGPPVHEQSSRITGHDSHPEGVIGAFPRSPRFPERPAYLVSS